MFEMKKMTLESDIQLVLFGLEEASLSINEVKCKIFNNTKV